MKFSVFISIATLASTPAFAAPTTLQSNTTASIEGFFKTLKQDPKGRAELLADGTAVVSYDAAGRVIDSAAVTQAAVDEYTNRISALYETFRQGYQDQDLGHGGQQRGGGQSGVYQRIDDEIFSQRLDCNQYACDDDDDCKIVGCEGGCFPGVNVMWFRCRW